ncbi:hypothetical protein M8C21_029288 [Ambrosia artemisiifolia]|uniref:Uncharacterized protein n=1 Tax=Ambrosia artemisiifolia TaxID=4212 RepID=A0AAD5CI31_AMBAR|nr:hypothetical protein M8C21_029288 [Ambrosia artemisiifolia]
MNCKEKVEKLEEKVMTMLIDYENGGSSTLQLLELIDDIERMGLGYRFQTNITKVLSKVASKDYEPKEEEEDNLHVASLKFRLLRQHGFSVSQGSSNFIDGYKSLEIGSFKRPISIKKKFNKNDFVGNAYWESFSIQKWGELTEAFFVEAKWNHSDYMPTLEDYLDNAWQSVSGVLVLTHGYLLMNQDANKDGTESSMEKFGDLFKWSSMIFRLYNDLATSSDEMDRGKSINAISCYMHENDVGEEVAREYINTLIDKAWRRMIEARVACFDDSKDPFIDMAINLARISHSTYQFGDGHGAPDARSRDRVLSVIFEPITEKEH